MADSGWRCSPHPPSAIRHPPFPLRSHIRSKSYRPKTANHIPADIDLPPVAAETRRSRTSVMIAVPVFAPCRYLERAKPPDVLAGIDTFRGSRFQVQKAVHETLQVQAVRHADRADPEESGPAEDEIAKA